MRDNMEEMDTTSQSAAVINSTPPVNNVTETPQNEVEPVSNEETKTEKMEVEEESDKKADLNKTALIAVLQFLKKHNLQIESKFLIFCLIWTILNKVLDCCDKSLTDGVGEVMVPTKKSSLAKGHPEFLKEIEVWKPLKRNPGLHITRAIGSLSLIW
ncbi:hypothetical protein TNCT_135521 [Trichonephila clavata]|uniref:Uncharacterized protein n=1 Tax=Trichonephila clavata TaxID=2740835 RepID=A0A8X6KQ30_TRICU|nr:hypothetical protein TNCT_135521 [Trichonephila clavata]